MEPVTVEITQRMGNLVFLNCGAITPSPGGYIITVGDHTLMLMDHAADPLAAAQKFADLLVDVTADAMNAKIDRLHGPGASAALDAALADGSIFGDNHE